MKNKTLSPWFAVNLSFFFAGIGQIFTGYIWRGILIIFTQCFFLIGALWHMFHPSGYTLLAMGSAFAFALIHAMNLFDIYEILSPPGEKMNHPKNCKDDIWQAVFLSRIFPPLGLFKNNQNIPGILTIIMIFMIGYLRFKNLYAIMLIPFVTTLACVFILKKESQYSNLLKHLFKPLFLMAILISTLFVNFTPFLLFRHLTRPFYIPSESMEPQLLIGDRILVNKNTSYTYKRGDIVVFNLSTAEHHTFCKRVVAFEGETIEIKKNQIRINGNPVDKGIFKEIPHMSAGQYGITGRPFQIPKGYLFLMGDNSPWSFDSRNFGPVPIDNIIGRAYKIFWPIKRNNAL